MKLFLLLPLLIPEFLHADDEIPAPGISPHAPICEVVCLLRLEGTFPDAGLRGIERLLEPSVLSAHGRILCQHTERDGLSGALTAHGLCGIGTVWYPDVEYAGRSDPALREFWQWYVLHPEGRDFETLAVYFRRPEARGDTPDQVRIALSRLSGLLRLRTFRDWRGQDCSEVLRYLEQCSEAQDLPLRGIAYSGLIRLDRPPTVQALLRFFARTDDTDSMRRYRTSAFERGALQGRILNDINSRLGEICRDFDDPYSSTENAARRQAAREAGAKWKDFDLIAFVNGLPAPVRQQVVVAEMIGTQIDENGVPAMIGRTYRKGSSLLLVPLLDNADRDTRLDAAMAIDRMVGHLHKFPYARRPDDAVDRYVEAVRDWIKEHPDWERHCEQRLLGKSQMISDVDAKYPHVESGLVDTYLAKIKGQDEPHGSELPGELADMGENAMPILIRCLCDDNKTVRYCAMKALGKMGNGAATFLVYLLRSYDRGLRFFSVQEMGELDGPPEAVRDALSSALEYDANPTIRKYAVRALEKTAPDTDSVRPLLRKALDDPDPGVREEAVNALKRLENTLK